MCADVVIKDDSSVELTETFFIKLERGPFLPLPGVPLNVSYAVVTLLDSDDDSKYIFCCQFNVYLHTCIQM